LGRRTGLDGDHRTSPARPAPEEGKKEERRRKKKKATTRDRKRACPPQRLAHPAEEHAVAAAKSRAFPKRG
jgi:hypothetical protein